MSLFAISDIGRRQFHSQEDPDGSYGRNQVQFPAVPAQFGPMSFLVD